VGSSGSSASGSTYGRDTTGSVGSASGSTYGQNPTGSAGSTSGSTAAGGSVAGSASDNSNLKTVTGSVAKVDENSITLDTQSAGGVTLTIDSQTQIVRRGQPISSGVSSIHEGEQVRASFDPASNRADKIEVMGKAKKMKQQKGASDAPPANPDRK
jgi:hypothetical protein